MSRFVCVVSFALVLSGVSLAAEQARDPSFSKQQVPEVINFYHGGYDDPIFVAASRMISADGFPREEFPTYAKLAYELYEAAEANTSPCLNPSSSVEFETGSDSRRDLRTAIRTSDVVLMARVTGSRSGFLHADIAGTLYQFSPIEVLRGQHSEEERYFFFPAGEFKLGRVSVCKSHPDYADQPSVGDRVLLIYNNHWYNDSGIVYTGGSTGVVTMKSDGRASLPRRFRDRLSDSERPLNSDLEDAIHGFVREVSE